MLKKTFKQFVEDFGGAVSASDAGPPTNNVGSGNIAGTGVGPQGEPPGPKGLLNKRKGIYRRKNTVNEAVKDVSYRIFDCNALQFYNCRINRRKFPRLVHYMGDDTLGMQVKQFATQNGKSGIVLRNKLTKEMMYLRHPK